MCRETKLVTKYFDLYGKVIIHWYDKQERGKAQESREWRERGKRLRGRQRDEREGRSLFKVM